MDIAQVLQGMLGGQGGEILKPLLASLGGQGQAAGLAGGAQGGAQAGAKGAAGAAGASGAAGAANSIDINAMLEKLRNAGLGNQADSWVAKGKNESVSPDQINKAFGADTVHQIATQAGVSDQQAATDISKVLPKLVDKLSPNGQLPDPTQLQGALGKVLGGR